MDSYRALQMHKPVKRRARLAALVLLAVFCGLAGRLFAVQVLRTEHYRAALDRQSRLEEDLPAPRGRIVTADGTLYAQSRLGAKSVYVNPRAVRDAAAVAAQLGRALDLDPRALYHLLWEKRDKYFVWIKRRISLAQERALEALNLDGVGYRPEHKRHYPAGARAGQVLGCVGEEGGLEGLERRYEELLRGQPGHRFLLRDALMNKIVDVDMPLEEPVSGHDLALTIHDPIQGFAEAALAEIGSRWAPESACALVMDPHTGELLALANWPPFDPNEVARSAADQRRNRAVTDGYEPGSIFKPFTFAAVLAAGLATLDERLDCASLRCGYRTLRDAHPHGALTVRDVLAKSSNIGTAKLALRLTPEVFRGALVAFGFGQATGLDFPGEAAGRVPPADTWKPCDETVSNSFGQGIAVTPLQMLAAFNAFAAGGRVYRPFLVKRVIDAAGRTVAEARPQYRTIGTPEVYGTMMRDALEEVVKTGTGKPMRIKGYRMAGKTGTADIPGPNGYGRHGVVGSFVALAPVEDPVITVLVMVNHPTKTWNGRHWWGGNVAGPATAEIVEQTLAFLGVPRSAAG